jgi:two-component system, cell cycle sensor histidine kinase and response regulator CckA
MKRVLIVDDKPDNVYLLRALLQGNGYVVEEACHGAEALVKARQAPPTLVIADLLMPVMDGFTLLKHWKADEQLKCIPFVVYTATYTDAKDERLALNLGADAFIIKPAEPEPFMASIQDVLAKGTRGELTPAPERPLEDGFLLKEYNEVLVRKLETKALLLEQTNRELLEEIAERKRIEATAARTSDLLRAVVDGTPDAIFVKDRGGKYLLLNDAAARFFGKSVAEILGKDDTTIFAPADAQTVMASDRLVMESNQIHVVEDSLLAAGTVRTFHSTKAPYRDAGGNVIGVIGISRDITDRKSLEEQLRHSQKMEAVGRLAGGVAHDFNNLLTIISGYSEFLLATPEVGDAIREAVKAISQAGERAASLTRQLLGFSRRTLLQPKVFDLNDLVAETGKMLRRLIGEDILFTTVLGPNVSQVRVDPGQLDQVLMNLVVNARDAMPQGGKLTIETANVELSQEYASAHPDCQAGRFVMMAITDTGCGMAPDVMARIFEPFFTTKPVGKGTGLGLAMVFGIVQQSGGCIHVYSEPDRGTTFKIYLPAVTEQLSQKTESIAKVGPRGTETVLLVEDDEAVRGLALMSLTMHGYQVLTAVDGKDALRVVQGRQGDIDLVLTDVVMPNASGPELAETLRLQSPKIKFLFMSGYTDDAVVRHGLLQANVAFIQKPYTPLELAQKVRQVLDEDKQSNSHNSFQVPNSLT